MWKRHEIPEQAVHDLGHALVAILGSVKSSKVAFAGLLPRRYGIMKCGFSTADQLVLSPINLVSCCSDGCILKIITRKELNKRMISSAGTRKLYMMQLGDNT